MISESINKTDVVSAQKQSTPKLSATKSAETDGKATAISNKSTKLDTIETQESSEKTNKTELSNAVKQINEYAQNIKRDIEFSVDDDTGRTVIRVYDSNTEELIRQIPNEEVIELAKNLKSNNGLILNAKA